jgi:hypothetical protein
MGKVQSAKRIRLYMIREDVDIGSRYRIFETMSAGDDGLFLLYGICIIRSVGDLSPKSEC